MRGLLLAFLQAFDRSRQFTFGQGVWHKLISALAQQLVQCGRADIFGDEDHLDLLGLGQGDDFPKHDKVFFIGVINGKRNELKRLRFGLVEECQSLGKAKVAPAFAQDRFHVFDQQIEVLDIAADRAGLDWAGICRWIRTTRHYSVPFLILPRNLIGFCQFRRSLACCAAPKDTGGLLATGQHSPKIWATFGLKNRNCAIWSNKKKTRQSGGF